MIPTKNEAPSNLLRTKRYALYWVSSLFSNIGTWMQQVAQPWVILNISHSAFWVGMDSFVMNAPGWVFTLWGGILADRLDRKKIVLICQSIQFICVLLLLALLMLGKIQIWIILVSSFFIGVTDSLSMPAFQSIIPSIVNEKDVPRAIALNSIQFNLSRILGPALAGIVIAAYGASICYGANLISYIPFFLSLYWIYPKAGFKKEVDIGVLVPSGNQFKQILTDRTYQYPLITIFVTTLFCSPLITFCPVIVKDVFHGDAHDLGWSMTAVGIGGVLGGIVTSLLPARMSASQSYANALAVLLGLSLVVLLTIPSLLFFDSLIVFAGAALTMSNTTNNSILQRSAHNHIRGQVMSLFQTALHGGMSVGSLVMGMMASGFGIRNALFINGVIAVILQLGILYFYRKSKKRLV